MNKVLGYIFSPIHYLFFGFFICLFQPIQWLCYNLGGQEAHKKSVDLLNFFLVGTYYLMGSSINFKNIRPVILIKQCLINFIFFSFEMFDNIINYSR